MDCLINCQQVCSSIVDTTKSLAAVNARQFSISSRLLAGWPQVQQPAPDFSGTAVVNGDFKDIKLSDYRGKYVVLFFYPLDL